MLDMEARRANRAGTSGLGPSHQTAVLPILLAYAAALDLPWSDLLPVGPHCVVTVAAIVILREIEVSLLLQRYVPLIIHAG